MANAPRPTPPPAPPVPRPPAGPDPRRLLDAARAWGRVAIAVAELTVSIARGRAL